MKIFAINGSPRKKWNTATILQNALDGAREVCPDAETEIIHLYDLKYTGCVSCFQCKRLGGASYGKCAVKDGLAPVLPKLLEADVLIFGTPIYFSDYTGMMRSFLERLYFPNFVYDKNYSSLAPKKLWSAFIYTMNVPMDGMEKWHYPERLSIMRDCATRLFGHECKALYVCDTFQFSDYSKYKMELFSAEEKKEHREKHFPVDCENARKLGAELAASARG